MTPAERAREKLSDERSGEAVTLPQSTGVGDSREGDASPQRIAREMLTERRLRQYPTWRDVEALCDGLEAEIAAALAAQTAQTRALEHALKLIVCELGVPGDGYPAPVANAYEIARAALTGAPRDSHA